MPNYLLTGIRKADGTPVRATLEAADTAEVKRIAESNGLDMATVHWELMDALALNTPVVVEDREVVEARQVPTAASAPAYSALPPQPAPAPQQHAPIVNNVIVQVGNQEERQSGLIPALASLLIPGLGQLIQGRLLAGVFWFVITIIGYIAFVVPGLVLHVLCILSAASGVKKKGGGNYAVIGS